MACISCARHLGRCSRRVESAWRARIAAPAFRLACARRAAYILAISAHGMCVVMSLHRRSIKKLILKSCVLCGESCRHAMLSRIIARHRPSMYLDISIAHRNGRSGASANHRGPAYQRPREKEAARPPRGGVGFQQIEGVSARRRSCLASGGTKKAVTSSPSGVAAMICRCRQWKRGTEIRGPYVLQTVALTGNEINGWRRGIGKRWHRLHASATGGGRAPRR